MEENQQELENKLENQDNEQNNNEETPKKIEVVNGNGDLTISPVYEHLEVEKPKPKEIRKIFVPEVKGNSNSPKDENIDENNSESNNDNDDDAKNEQER